MYLFQIVLLSALGSGVAATAAAAAELLSSDDSCLLHTMGKVKLASSSPRRRSCDNSCQQCQATVTANAACAAPSAYNVSSCQVPFAEPSATVSMSNEIASDTYKMFFALMSPLTDDTSGILETLLGFFFDGGSTYGNTINDLYTQTQEYVTEQVGISQLETLYEQIMGYQADVSSTNQAYNLWQGCLNSCNETLTEFYFNNYQTETLALITDLTSNFYLYACSNPWNGDGSNGYGIFYAQYVTIFMGVLANYVGSVPGAGSLQQQWNMVQLANNAINFASEMVMNYITLRMSYIGSVEFQKQQQETCFECSSDCASPALYKATDQYPVYNTDGTIISTCTWTATANTGYLCPGYNYQACCYCGQSVINSAVSQAIACRNLHVNSVIEPIAENWALWLLEPASYWYQMADLICQQNQNSSAPNSETEQYCSTLQTTRESLPTKAELKALPEKYAAASKVQCAASYGAKLNDAVCCGQQGVINDVAYVCSKLMPTCVGYQYDVTWGYCTQSLTSDTAGCAIPVSGKSR